MSNLITQSSDGVPKSGGAKGDFSGNSVRRSSTRRCIWPKKITITSYWCSTVTLRQVASRRAGLTLIIYRAGRLACMHLKHNSCDGRRHRGRDTTPICYLCGVANGLPKLNTRNCGLYIPHYIQKITSFCQVLKEMHTKENWFLFSASRCSTRNSFFPHESVSTPIHDRLIRFCTVFPTDRPHYVRHV